MSKKPLSERQQRILRYIAESWLVNGYPPSIREIGESCQVSSTSVVNYNLNILEKCGYLLRDNRISRGMRVSEAGFQFLGISANAPAVPRVNVNNIPVLREIPLAGYIAAGPLTLADNRAFATDEFIALTRDLVGDESDLFALRVRGNSMIDALVNDGDLVVLKSQQTARNGEMVAVLVNGQETTLKYFYLEQDRVRLQPANPFMNPIYAAPQNVQVQGRVVMVLRQLGAGRSS
jgi:repressor LexA